MTDKTFYTLFGAAQKAKDRDAFASDWALSTIWDDGPERSPEELFETCGRVWDLAHLTIRDIREHLGLSQIAFATRFCIPRRTVEGWEARGTCPPYIVLLLARAAGMTGGVENE
ncbi:MAG TPA: helix-turn-helix transcriptional regulator [Candidatus Onthomonas avicola]|nr:helix-turn-helix transcriptional regulator [Candidatus Onthomonas avicola]